MVNKYHRKSLWMPYNGLHRKLDTRVSTIGCIIFVQMLFKTSKFMELNLLFKRLLINHNVLKSKL